VPSLLLVLLGFAERGPYGEIVLFTREAGGGLVWHLTLENYRRLLGYGIFGYSTANLWILLRTLWLALATTVLSIALAYPVAFFIALQRPRWRYFWLVLLMVPFGTNMVIRIYAWQLILSTGQPPAALAVWLHLIAPGDSLYPGTFAVYIGMVTNSLPFAALPLYTNVERLDWSLVEAARDLYSRRWRVFRHGILPQTYAGLTVAFALTFIPSLGMFVVPDLLGGAKHMLLGNLIQQQFGASRNFPYGAALSFALVVLTLLAMQLIPRRRLEGPP
jgi:spermidine/putrescine transport system permease protein